jgi:hypothetical protein
MALNVESRGRILICQTALAGLETDSPTWPKDVGDKLQTIK